MAATTAQVNKLRRMVADPTPSNEYSDADLAGYIEAHPLVDARGEDPTVESSTTPGTLEANPEWTPTYDLNAAAADIWTEKAAALQPSFNFSADGASYSSGTPFDNAMKLARYYKGKSAVTTVTAKMQPNRRLTDSVIGNLAETDEEDW